MGFLPLFNSINIFHWIDNRKYPIAKGTGFHGKLYSYPVNWARCQINFWFLTFCVGKLKRGGERWEWRNNE